MSFGRAEADEAQFVNGEADEGRAEHRQQRKILQWIIEQMEQVYEIRHFQAPIETSSRHLQGNVQARELLGISFSFVGGRAQQNRYVAPINRPEILPVPNQVPAGLQF